MKLNPLTQIDFYKADHRSQYPKGTNMIYSNMTPRSDRLYNGTKFWDGLVVNVGLQGFMKWFLIDCFNDEFFNKPKDEVVGYYKRRMDTSLGEGAITVEHIEALHDLGYLPVEIRALPEGSKSPIKVPVFTIHNTLPQFAWLVNYLETVISNALWKSYTIGTIAAEYRAILECYFELTGAPTGLISFMAHDFSARGMGHPYDSAQSSFSHLASFVGTDTVSAIDYAEDYYNANAYNELIGTSVPATEHSVMVASILELVKRMKLVYTENPNLTLEQIYQHL